VRVLANRLVSRGQETYVELIGIGNSDVGDSKLVHLDIHGLPGGIEPGATGEGGNALDLKTVVSRVRLSITIQWRLTRA
jgi:hypothetical protein